ncbi:MAG TPA: sigma-70 family RNA polymerase sigma factor [Frankiaceae bacterium]|nr:sigma-70 family RNA polymerase sigma factor [Frankiaceae bacterium]
MTVARVEPDEPGPEWSGAEFAAICDSHRGRLVRWLTAIFGPRDAEDIAQEALVRLYERPGMLDEDADPWPWLAVVARNVGRDMARHNAFSLAVDAETLDRLPDAARVHEQVVARDDAERLHLALRAITPRDRALITLRDVQGVSVGDIAERLGMNDNAVRQQLFRARKRLASAYTELGGDRQAGLLAGLGVRWREFVRKHGHVFDALGPTASQMLAHAGPVAAAIVAGVLVIVTGGPEGTPATPAASSAPYSAPALDPRESVRHPRALGASLGGVATRTAPPDSDPPLFEYERKVGPASIRTTVYKLPVGDGQKDDTHVRVDDVPVVGYVEVTSRQSTYGNRRRDRLCKVFCRPS